MQPTNEIFIKMGLWISMEVNENIKNIKKVKTKIFTAEICNFMYAK